MSTRDPSASSAGKIAVVIDTTQGLGESIARAFEARSRPFERLIDPAEVARAYLSSDESSPITGVDIDVDQTIVGIGDASLLVEA